MSCERCQRLEGALEKAKQRLKEQDRLVDSAGYSLERLFGMRDIVNIFDSALATPAESKQVCPACQGTGVCTNPAGQQWKCRACQPQPVPSGVRTLCDVLTDLESVIGKYMAAPPNHPHDTEWKHQIFSFAAELARLEAEWQKGQK